MKAARRPEGRAKVRAGFGRWIGRVSSLGLVARARELWGFLNSAAVSHGDKALVVAALLYLISPIDVVPDFIPFAGWLDDLGVAAMVVNFVMRRLDAGADAARVAAEDDHGAAGREAGRVTG